MPALVRVIVDDLAIEEFIRTEAGPAIARAAGPAIAARARSAAPVYRGDDREHAPGLLRDSIGWRDTVDGGTEVYAAWYDIFLELPARQILTPIRTLEQALGDIPPVL